MDVMGALCQVKDATGVGSNAADLAVQKRGEPVDPRLRKRENLTLIFLHFGDPMS